MLGKSESYKKEKLFLPALLSHRKNFADFFATVEEIKIEKERESTHLE